MSSQELLQLQRSQMRKQDDAMDQLDSLVGKLKMTSNMIREEVDVQARMVEALDKDFWHTPGRRKELRTPGSRRAGEEDESAGAGEGLGVRRSPASQRQYVE
mgnify:CR=1 FL=1